MIKPFILNVALLPNRSILKKYDDTYSQFTDVAAHCLLLN